MTVAARLLPELDHEMAATRSLLGLFDERVAAVRQAIAACDDEAMKESWVLAVGRREVFRLPRAALLRSFVLDRMIHHRGQLSVYLRLLDVPLPPTYGPTADPPP